MGKLLVPGLLLDCTDVGTVWAERAVRSNAEDSVGVVQADRVVWAGSGGGLDFQRPALQPLPCSVDSAAPTPETSCVQDCENDLDLSGPKAVSTYCSDHVDFRHDFAVLPDDLD
ncbi:hypothetical protein TREES_T100008352 [Tupaia chinensis]|uniref:Uncharacterized protein n=1 Tax=Tupaia chinensis TaxID=246437 RepID=L9LBA7_TUPCH|nr:hypothetical protein TREES_T100008352 [Tupaia chinensis]